MPLKLCTQVAGPLAARTDDGWTAVNNRPNIGLPPEIWRLVFQHATDTYPAPLTAHNSSPRISISQPTISGPDDERRLIRASMEIKRTISLVCRAWRSIGFEFLFHTIHVTSQRTIPSLWYALREDSHRRPGGQGSEALTWWIRRIWVEDLGPLSWYILVSDKLPEYSVLGLVKRCPRLVEFAGPGLDKPLKKLDFSPLQPALHAICNSALSEAYPTGIETPTEDDHDRPGLSLSFRIADADEMNRFATANPSLAGGFSLLRSLYLHSGGAPGQGIVDPTPVHLPSLRFLSVRGRRALEQAFTFAVPSLTSLQYIHTHATDPLETLLITIGTGLVELELVNSTAYADGYLERTCPNLRVLHISSLDHFTSNTSDAYHSTLATLGVQQLYLGDAITRAGMSARIRRLQWAFPSLEVLRETSWAGQAMRQRAAMSGRFPERKYCGFWMCFADVVGNAGMRLVDWKGRMVAGFHLSERCSVEWDLVLERMLTVALEAVEEDEDGHESA
ncbi:hypothetical protein FRB90_000828 [Tulasnella sp. 427]|nr:hypothetical protein FRB90_000828 [Tulasnella sp. 427]